LRATLGIAELPRRQDALVAPTAADARDVMARITPKVMHDRVELDLPLTLSRKAG
jgi:hypothetical protein